VTGPAQLELDWLGGWSERRLRRRRPGIDDLPWGTLALDAYAPDDLTEARRVWTNGVFTEYASAAAFGNLATALLECGAPVDLSAVAADIVVDELAHVELVSRLVMELGGGVPYHADLSRISQVPDPDATPLLRALELAVTTSCVGEALSVPALTRSRALTRVPLVHRVLDRLVHDEGPHAELGLRILGWASPRLSPGDRTRLADLALRAIAVYAPIWQRGARPDTGAPALGMADFDDYRRTMITAVEDRIVARLARFDIHVDPAGLAPLIN
jgi:hypothetical protein